MSGRDVPFATCVRGLRRASPSLDLTDRRILEALQADARLSHRELGRRVSLSPPAVGRRVRRLEDEGVIVGYSADVEPGRIGLGITAFVDVTTHGPAASARLVAAVPEMREVIECHRLTGQRSYLLKVVVRSAEELERLIDTLMTFGRTATSVVLSSPIRRGPVRREATDEARTRGAVGAGGFEPP